MTAALDTVAARLATPGGGADAGAVTALPWGASVHEQGWRLVAAIAGCQLRISASLAPCPAEALAFARRRVDAGVGLWRDLSSDAAGGDGLCILPEFWRTAVVDCAEVTARLAEISAEAAVAEAQRTRDAVTRIRDDMAALSVVCR